MKTTIFDATYAKVTFDQDLKLVTITWDGTVTTEQYRNVFITTLEYQALNNAVIENFLSDIRNQGIVSPENRKWFEQVAIPRSIEQGLQRAGVVFVANVFKKYYLNLILSATNKFKLPLRFFNTVEEAETWFKSFDAK